MLPTERSKPGAQRLRQSHSHSHNFYRQSKDATPLSLTLTRIPVLLALEPPMTEKEKARRGKHRGCS